CDEHPAEDVDPVRIVAYVFRRAFPPAIRQPHLNLGRLPHVFVPVRGSPKPGDAVDILPDNGVVDRRAVRFARPAARMLEDHDLPAYIRPHIEQLAEAQPPQRHHERPVAPLESLLKQALLFAQRCHRVLHSCYRREKGLISHAHCSTISSVELQSGSFSWQVARTESKGAGAGIALYTRPFVAVTRKGAPGPCPAS